MSTMKRRLFIVLSITLIISIVFGFINAIGETSISINRFETRFNLASEALETDHKIQSDNISFSPGESIDMFTITISDAFVLQIGVLHNTTDICQAWIIYVPGASVEDIDSLSFLYLVTEILYAYGVIDEFTETETVMNDLDLVRHMEQGTNNTIVFKGVNIGIWCVAGISYIFAISSSDQ